MSAAARTGEGVPTRPWWRDAVVYQIYPRSFADSNGDGVGDLRGIIDRLDHLADLGVDVVWLSPVYPSPQDDNGYDIADYRDIDPVFGDLADFDELLAEAHQRGIRLVMDLVVNHTSDEHPWFADSRSSTGSARRDWYWWRPPRPGHVAGEPGAEPTNWESMFSGSAWELDEASGEYYLHLFSRKQPDLNWENPEVRRAVHDLMGFWLDRGVDGFRMDVINLVSKAVAPDGSLPDVPAADLAGRATGNGGAHYVDGPRIHEFLQEMHREVFAPRGSTYLRVAEAPGATTDQAVLYTDPERGEVDMVFQFEHVGVDQGGSKWDPVPLDLVRLKEVLGRWQTELAARGWNSLYWGNHDQPRPVSRWGDDGEHRVASATLLGTVLHLQRGTPYVYQGEEIGMANVPYTDLAQLRDIEARNWYADATAAGLAPAEAMRRIRLMGRDHARTPMQWDGGPQAGFTGGTPWIEVAPDFRTVNVAAQRDDDGSVLAHYRRLIALRHAEPTVVEGDVTMLAPEDPVLYAFTRSLGADTLLVLANWSGSTAALSHPDVTGLLAGGAELLLGNYRDPAGADGPTDAWTSLRPWEAVVLRLPPR